MKPIFSTFLLTAAVLSVTDVAGAEADQSKPSVAVNPNEVAVSLLFVQNARGLTYDADRGTLTLEDISPVVTFFSDRPHRIAGHVLLPGFLQAWAEGSDSFREDPPNADLSILEQGKVHSAVLELSAPQASQNQLTYKVKVLEGELPASGGVCSLFIDGLFRGAARGAAGGALIGAACGDAGKGAAIGAAAGGVAGEARSRRAMAYEMGRAEGMESAPVTTVAAPAPASAPAAPAPPATATMDVPNSNGSYTPVKLKQVPGGWQGPKGEIYPTFPTVDELKKVYGL